MTFHDGSTRETEYNAASDVVQYTDENQSVFEYTYDAMGRRIEAAITRAAGVVGTTAQAFQYDGLSRMTCASDTSGGSAAESRFFHDSLGRLVEEQQSYGGRDRLHLPERPAGGV